MINNKVPEENGIFELQTQLTAMAVAETNKQREIVRHLRAELATHLPIIWEQKEMIELLKQQLRAKAAV